MTGKYHEIYNYWRSAPEAFWAEAAKFIDWYRPYDMVLDDSRVPFYSWFSGGEVNVCYNVVDRHVAACQRWMICLNIDGSTVLQSPTQKVYSNASIKDKKEQIVELIPYIRSNSLSSVVEMAMQDMGIAILFGIVSEPLVQADHLTHILKYYHGKKWSFYFVHPYQVEKPIHVTRFYSLVKYFFNNARMGDLV